MVILGENLDENYESLLWRQEPQDFLEPSIIFSLRILSLYGSFEKRSLCRTVLKIFQDKLPFLRYNCLHSIREENMETKDLKVLLKAIELGSLSKASMELGYSTSAGSHIIERLEAQLGVSLLERSHSGVTSTRECDALLPYIRSILGEQDQMQKLAERLASKISSQLNIGSISSVSVSWLPEIVDSFLERFPEVHITTFDGSYTEIVQWLQDDTIDCAFLPAGVLKSFSFLPLRSDPFHVVFPKGHPLSEKETVHPLELRGYHVIIQAEGLNLDAPALTNILLDESTHVSSVHLRDLSVLSMVRHNRGIAILPELLIRNAGAPDIDSRPLRTGESRTICLAINNANGTVPSPVVKQFAAHVVTWATQE